MRQIETAGIVESCQQHNCGILCYSPLSQGLLTGKYARPGGMPFGWPGKAAARCPGLWIHVAAPRSNRGLPRRLVAEPLFQARPLSPVPPPRRGLRGGALSGHWCGREARRRWLRALVSRASFLMLSPPASAKIKEIAAEVKGATMATVSLAWALAQPGVTAVVVGASKPEQITRNTQAASLKVRNFLRSGLPCPSPLFANHAFAPDPALGRRSGTPQRGVGARQTQAWRQSRHVGRQMSLPLASL